MLTIGIDTINAPNIADLFAISLASTIMVPLKTPFAIKLSQFISGNMQPLTQSFPKNCIINCIVDMVVASAVGKVQNMRD